MAARRDPVDALAESTNARIQQLDQSIKEMDARLGQRIEQTNANIDKLGSRLESSINQLSGKMETFLEALNRMERGIDRMVRSWESQQRIMQEMMQHQAASTAQLQTLVNTQAQTVNRLIEAFALSKAS
jgi:methyl-accepting chemotaxis protein